MDTETPALREDGTLKDALEMEWFHSLSAETVELPPACEPVIGGSGKRALWQHYPSTKYKEAIAAEHRDWQDDNSDNELSNSVTVPSKRKQKSAQPRTGPKKQRRPAVEAQTASPEVSIIEEISKTSDQNIILDADAEADQPEVEIRRLKKNESTADILTMVREIEEEGKKGYECRICVARQVELIAAKRNFQIQTKFWGNSTAIRKHIARNFDTHFGEYWTAYDEKEIELTVKYLSKENLCAYTLLKEGQDPKTGRAEQVTLDGFVKPETTSAAWSKEDLLELILKFVAETDQPLNVTEAPSFRDILRYQRGSKARDSDVPHRSKFSEFVRERAQHIQFGLREEMTRAPGRISLTFDGWTSKGLTAFIAVTCHFVTQKWDLVSRLLSFRELDGTHSGENQAKHLYDVVSRFGIANKLMNLTSDNVSVNDTTLRLFAQLCKTKNGIEFDHKDQCSHCYSHAIALATRAFANTLSRGKLKDCASRVVAEANEEDDEDEDDAEALLSVLSETIDSEKGISGEDKVLAKLLVKVRAFISKVRRSTGAKKYLRTCVGMTPSMDEQTKKLELIAYCETRWETWENVVDRIIVLQKPVNYFISTADDSPDVPQVSRGQPRYDSFKFSELEWTLLGRILAVLKVANSIQQVFSSETAPTVFRVLPAFEDFRDELGKLKQKPDFRSLVPAVDAALKTIDKYHGKAMRSSAQVVCIYLNPCFKDEFFKETGTVDEEAERTMYRVYDKYEAELQAHTVQKSSVAAVEEAPEGKTKQPVPAGLGMKKLQAMVERRLQRESSMPKASREELVRYLADPLETGPVPVLYYDLHTGPVRSAVQQKMLGPDKDRTSTTLGLPAAVVWSREKQMTLIESIFRNFYIPPVLFYLHKDPVTKKLFYYTVPSSQTGKKLLIPPKYKQIFASKHITCDEFSDIGPAVERDIFQRVQLGMALTAAEKLAAISSPYAEWISELDIRHVRGVDDGLNIVLKWDASRGKHFQCIAQLVYCIENLPKRSMPTSSTLPGWLQKPNEPKESLKQEIEQVLKKYWMIASTDHLKQAFTVVKQMVAPVEFIFIGVLIAVLLRCEDDAIADEVLGLRQYVRALHKDNVRSNNRLAGSSWDFIEMAAKRHDVEYAWSLTTNGTTGKKRRRGKGDTGDDEYKAKQPATPIKNLGIKPGARTSEGCYSLHCTGWFR
ncbi:hypothetical protein ACEPAI_3338 [Sanghuangporus weigelae]